MKEKLIIKNFGPIKDVELELGRFNVLIGEQATGKSTVAKLLAVCRYFSYIIESGAAYMDIFGEGLTEWGLNEATQQNTYIFYDCIHYSITVERIHNKELDYDPEDGSVIGEFDASYFSVDLKEKSKEFKNLLVELRKIKPGKPDGYGFYDIEWRVPTSFLQNDVAKVLDITFYLPIERGLQSIFSLGKTSIQNISDTLFNQLAELDGIARLFKNDTQIAPLDITYKNVNGRGYIKSKKHDFVSLFNAASGYQSTVPIVLLIEHHSDVRKRNKAFLIEEPELNLFPEAQNKLMQYLADKTINYNNQLLLTTHSPYILTSLNNLMYAYQVGQEHIEEVNKIIDKKYWINPKDVSVYKMLPDGTCEDIMDKELYQIKVEKIDAISEVLNDDWHKMANLEYEASK